MVRAHLQEAAIILARLANEDRPDRCLHVVVDAASADTAIEHERLIVRVKHQLLGLAEVGAHERHPAVRELHVRRLDGQRQTLKCDRLMAPVELVRLAGRKAQRYERLCRNPCPFVPPRSREPVHAVVGAVIAATTQLFEQPLGRPPFPPGQFGFFLQNPGQNLDPLAQFWRRLNATLIPELGRPPADHLAHRRARNRQRPHNLFDRQMPLEKSASYLSDLVHADHPHKPLPANTGQQKGTLTKRQRGSRLDAKNTPQGVIIASEFTVGLVHLHLECGTGMSRIEANNVKPSLAQFMHKPRRHRAGFDPNAGIVSRMPSHRPLNLLRICMTLASPESATRIVNHADRSQLLRNVQTNKSGHRAVSHVRTAGQQRPDHGTMERSGPQPRLPDVHIRAYNPIKDVSGASLLPFVQSAAVPGALIHTDGWGGYSGLTAAGYKHEVTVVSASPDPAHVVMPRVHNIAALLKRWLLGTHQGGVQHIHLDWR